MRSSAISRKPSPEAGAGFGVTGGITAAMGATTGGVLTGRALPGNKDSSPRPKALRFSTIVVIVFAYVVCLCTLSVYLIVNTNTGSASARVRSPIAMLRDGRQLGWNGGFRDGFYDGRHINRRGINWRGIRSSFFDRHHRFGCVGGFIAR